MGTGPVCDGCKMRANGSMDSGGICGPLKFWGVPIPLACSVIELLCLYHAACIIVWASNDPGEW